MTVPKLPALTSKDNQIVALSIRDQTGLSCEQLAATRVSAVELHVLDQQEQILNNLSKLKNNVKTLIDEKTDIKNKWKEKQEEDEAKKVGDELAKLSFASNLSLKVISEYSTSSKKEEANSLIIISYLHEADKKSRSGLSVPIKEIKAVFDEETKSKVEKIDNELETLALSIKTETTRLDKCGYLLANMDREERRARALLVESKLNTMEDGDVLIAALRSNMPTI